LGCEGQGQVHLGVKGIAYQGVKGQGTAQFVKLHKQDHA
jgi:hypothetical protein